MAVTELADKKIDLSANNTETGDAEMKDFRSAIIEAIYAMEDFRPRKGISEAGDGKTEIGSAER